MSFLPLRGPSRATRSGSARNGRAVTNSSTGATAGSRQGVGPGGPALCRAAAGVVEGLERRWLFAATTFQLTGAPTAAEGSDYVLALPAAGPGGETIQGWEIDWADGSNPDGVGGPGEHVAGGTAQVTHRYADGSAATASLTVTATATFATVGGGGGAGSVDAGFGSGGLARTDVPTQGFTADAATAVAPLPGGKVLVAGSSGFLPNSGGNIALVRYNADGSPDTSFGNRGLASLVVASGSVGAVAVGQGLLPGHAQDEGKAVVAGLTNTTVPSLARFNADGSVDSTFGTGGLVTLSAAGDDGFSGVAVLPDGHILAAGQAIVDHPDRANGPLPADDDFVVYRFNANGSLDTTFGQGGRATVDFGTAAAPSFDRADGMVVTAGGQIVVSGHGLDGGTFEVARLTANGQLDAGFGAGGIATAPIAGGGADAVRAAVGGDGGVVLWGQSFDASGASPHDAAQWSLARFDSHGNFDAGFGGAEGDGGVVSVNAGESETAGGVTVVAGGSIVAAGRAYVDSAAYEHVFVKFHADGTRDAAFGTGGVARPGTADRDPTSPQAFAVTAGGQFLAAGVAPAPRGFSDIAAWRFNADGSVDAGFGGPGGVVTDYPSRGKTRGRGAAARPGGGTVVLGSAGYLPTDRRVVLLGYTATGQLDPAFGAAGVVARTFGTGGDTFDAKSLAVGTVGGQTKFYVAGHLGGNDAGGGQMAVARFNADGSVDAGFGTNGLAATADLAGPGSDGFATANDLVVRPDGSVLLGGTVLLTDADGNTVTGLAAVRFGANGTLDTAFGANGLAVADFIAEDQGGQRITVDGGGNVLVAGYVARRDADDNLDQDLAVARFLPNGAADPSFGPAHDGKTEVVTAGLGAAATGGVVTTGGGIVVAGTIGSDVQSGDEDVALIRLSANGTPDATFGGTGVVTTGRAAGDQAGDLTVVGGKLVVTGTYAASDGAHLAAWRYAADGTPDGTFGPGGVVVGAAAGGGRAAVDAGGRLVVAGSITDPTPVPFGPGSDVAVTRFLLGAVGGGTATATASLTVRVNNVAPTVTLAGATALVANARQQTLSFSGGFTDPGTNDGPWTAAVDYGDGSGFVPLAVTAAKTFAFTHTYASAGNYTVTVRVTDKDGGPGTATRTLATVPVQLQPDPADPTKTALVVGGTAGNDPITVTAAAGGQVSVSSGGANLGTFAPTGRVVVWAGAGNDVVTVGPGVNVPAELHGGDGNDVLLLGAAGGVAVGGKGVDVLTGGAGRALLVGSAGADVIAGAAGEDILVGGLTSYDDDPVALWSIWREWNRTDRTYAQRVTRLRDGTAGGLNGPYALRSDGAAQTVFDDSASDTLATDVLAGGSGQDWYLYNYQDGGQNDIVVGLAGNETRTDIDPT